MSAPTSDAGRRLEELLEDGSDYDIALGLNSAVHEETDKAWLYQLLVRLTEGDSPNLAAAAATQIGNLARFHGFRDDSMLDVLEALQARSPSSFAEDALEDVRFALGRGEGG